MKTKFIISSILLSMTACAANATTLNIRHEYLDGKDDAKSQHKDRLLIIHRFNNGIGLTAELKWANPKDENLDLGEFSNAGHELGINYTYKVTDSFTLQPEYLADTYSTGVIHKYQLKGTKKLTNDWNAALRYRFADVNRTEASGLDDSQYGQLNLTSSYKLDEFKFGLDIEYKMEESSSTGFKGDENYLNLVNISAEYSGFESGWNPFVEFAMVAVNAGDEEGLDDYAPRYRIGMKYSF